MKEKTLNLESSLSPMPLDSLSLLAGSLRPQSVPLWLDGDKHIPKRSQLPPRIQSNEYSYEDGIQNTKKTSMRPKGPIYIDHPSSTLMKKSTNNKKNVDSRDRSVEQQQHKQRGRRARGNRTTVHRVSLSLNESLDSLHDFGKTNRGRQLSQKDTVTYSSENPEGNVHFVNIDDDDLTRPYQDTSSFQVREIIETLDGTHLTAPSNDFRIPELPKGQNLSLNILSTCKVLMLLILGETPIMFCFVLQVGLMGIEIFDRYGHIIQLGDKNLSADPPDTRMLSDHQYDPRTIDKLFDGHNYTCDDLHAWLAPFQRGENHFIFVDFDETTEISMIRIWNYNASRIHSYRGARYLEITLDGQFIFKGEIKRAAGAVGDIENCSECVLFTTNEMVLQLIEKYDKYSSKNYTDTYENSAPFSGWMKAEIEQRPKTGEAKKKKEAIGLYDPRAQVKRNSSKRFDYLENKEERVENLADQRYPFDRIYSKEEINELPTSKKTRPQTAPLSSGKKKGKAIVGQILELSILSNWGDPSWVGLTGIEVLDDLFCPITLQVESIQSSNNCTKLSNLLAPPNTTTLLEHMWTAPLQDGLHQPLKINIEMKMKTPIGGLKIWNYNASLEESYKGAKRILAVLDGNVVSPIEGFLVRKAPGNTSFDFGQFVSLQPSKLISTLVGEGIYSSLLKNNQEEIKTTIGNGATPIPHPNPIPTSATMTTSFGVDNFSLKNSSNKNSSISSEYDTIQPKNNKNVLENTNFKRDQVDIQQKYAKNSAPKCTNRLLEHEKIQLKSVGERVQQQYLTPLLPCGCIFTFSLISTWGDPFYIGLNGLELYDDYNNLIPLNSELIAADPRDITILPDSSDDIRTLDKLYDGVNNTYDDHHLCKTPSRGVQEFKILIDDVLVYQGILKQAPEKPSYEGEPWMEVVEMGQVILFTDDIAVVEEELPRIYNPMEDEREGIMFINDSQVVSKEPKQNLIRPTTCVRRK